MNKITMDIALFCTIYGAYSNVYAIQERRLRK